MAGTWTHAHVGTRLAQPTTVGDAHVLHLGATVAALGHDVRSHECLGACVLTLNARSHVVRQAHALMRRGLNAHARY